MGAHLNAYSTREHTAYYIKALAKDLPKGDAWAGDGTAGVQRTGRQEPLAWPKKEVTLGVWPCRKATGVPGLGGLGCYWSPVARLVPKPALASSCGAPGGHCAELQPGGLPN